MWVGRILQYHITSAPIPSQSQDTCTWVYEMLVSVSAVYLYVSVNSFSVTKPLCDISYRALEDNATGRSIVTF